MIVHGVVIHIRRPEYFLRRQEVSVIRVALYDRIRVPARPATTSTTTLSAAAVVGTGHGPATTTTVVWMGQLEAGFVQGTL